VQYLSICISLHFVYRDIGSCLQACHKPTISLLLKQTVNFVKIKKNTNIITEKVVFSFKGQSHKILVLDFFRQTMAELALAKIFDDKNRLGAMLQSAELVFS
jgi:hypothetical protein